MDLVVRGGDQFKALARSLRAAGDPGRGLRRKVRRNIVAAVRPMQTAVKANALAIPTHGDASTGLRSALAKATKIRVRASGSSAVVRLETAHPLAAYMEGSDGARRVNWRHPVYEDETRHPTVWVSQDSHPYFAPGVTPLLPGVRVAVVAAVDETAAEVERGI